MAKGKSPQPKAQAKNTFGPPIPRHTKTPRRPGITK